MFPKPPKFVFNNKPVAVQVVQHRKAAAGAVDKHVLVVNPEEKTGNTDKKQSSTKKQHF